MEGMPFVSMIFTPAAILLAVGGGTYTLLRIFARTSEALSGSHALAPRFLIYPAFSYPPFLFWLVYGFNYGLIGLEQGLLISYIFIAGADRTLAAFLIQRRGYHALWLKRYWWLSLILYLIAPVLVFLGLFSQFSVAA